MASDADEILHAAEIESLERRIMDMALERTGANNGAIFLWDKKNKGLEITFHIVDGVVVNIPGVVLRPRRDGRPNGIALTAFEQNEAYLSNDTRADANYAHYFQEVLSIAAVPIPYQGKPIGVITASSRKTGAFTEAHVAELSALAQSSAKFLRRAQLYRASAELSGRPFLIKGLSPAWLRVEQQIERVSPTDAPVLIHGESGTGKELTAHAIHFNSRRASGPFVAVNCAAIPETLLESVLFGHVKGAFTGASFNKVGEFEKADGGTLFLDELGELPLMLQPKVLRAMESGEVQPLGSNKPPRRVDVRVVCATNRDLPAMVRDGQFRDDLYYRLSVVTLELPPLRSYKDNLDILAQVFVQQAAERHKKPTPRISAACSAVLHAYDFPGNVRELKNSIEHAVIMATGDEIRPEDLPRSFTATRPAPKRQKQREATLAELRESWLAPLETRYLTDLLATCDGNVRAAAERAGVNTVTMYRLLKKRGLTLKRRVQAEP
ncbi:MAG: sigma-54-dependent Fis family transcriptional regulator [Myxococcales bacterium]|nr:sigma-54-dependent Fis family transcriptional regulator [Myxococcales bacterium]MCB9581670.1 sigma-54-dependent Fis family transcriptional regulator [Polyangiaceae bacterium]